MIAISHLSQHYPLLFNVLDVRPLAIGIHKTLRAHRLKGSLAMGYTAISLGVNHWVQSL